MIDFLQGVLLVFAIFGVSTVATAVWLVAWGTRRQKLADAWEDGYGAALFHNLARQGKHPPRERPGNPYLREREQLHRA
jgi:hypothetical protein